RPPEPVAPGVPTAGRSRTAGPAARRAGGPADVAVGRGPCAATVGCDGARVGRGASRTCRIGWGQELGFAEVEPGQGELVRLADERVGFAIAERQELVAVEISRRDGDGELLGAFDDVEDARRFLALELCVLHRCRSVLPQLRAS